MARDRITFLHAPDTVTLTDTTRVKLFLPPRQPRLPLRPIASTLATSYVAVLIDEQTDALKAKL